MKKICKKFKIQRNFQKKKKIILKFYRNKSKVYKMKKIVMKMR